MCVCVTERAPRPVYMSLYKAHGRMLARALMHAMFAPSRSVRAAFGAVYTERKDVVHLSLFSFNTCRRIRIA